MWKRLTLAFVLLLAAASCATTPVAGQCPESAGLKCLTRQICDQDKKRGCMVCTCEQGWNSDRQNEEERLRGRTP